MKKLKCSSCGGNLKVEDNKEYAVCEYCGSRYKLNEDLNINLKMDDSVRNIFGGGFAQMDGFSKGASKVIIVFAIGMISIIAMTMFFRFGHDFSSNPTSNIESNTKADVDHFNFQFYGANGTNTAFLVKKTLDDIIQSNKTNDRKVILDFEGNETTDESEIINIKHSLSGSYEVSLNYDDVGYIYKISVEKIK